MNQQTSDLCTRATYSHPTLYLQELFDWPNTENICNYYNKIINLKQAGSLGDGGKDRNMGQNVWNLKFFISSMYVLVTQCSLIIKEIIKVCDLL